MNIRVAHVVNPTFGSVFSGQSHYLFSLLSGWNDKDICLDLFGTQIKPINMNSGDRNYHLPPGSFWSSPHKKTRWGQIRWSLDLMILLIKRRHEYEIVHFHVLNWGALLSPILLHPLGKKVVFTMSLFGNDNPSHLLQQPRGKLQVALLRLFDGAIGLAPALVDDAINNGIHNVICLPNFLAFSDLEKDDEDSKTEQVRSITRNNLGIPQTSKIMLFIGAIIPRKGVDTLVDAFIELSKRHDDIFLIIIGPKNENEGNDIRESFVKEQQEKIKRYKLEDHVFWIGMVKEQSLLVEYYRAADIFVFPTRNEGLGNVLIEASAAKLPVVATHLPGITDEVILNGMNGYLIEPERSDLFADAIDQLLADNAKREEMGIAGRRFVLEKFGFETYCQKLRDFYLNLRKLN